MFALVSLAIAAAAIALVFVGKWAGWLLLGLAALLLTATLYAMKGKKIELKLKLSAAAAQLLEKYRHYYLMPQAARDLGRAAIVLHIAGLVVAAVGAFRGFYPGLLLGAIYFVLLAMLARAFDPNNFNQDPAEKELHQEIALAISDATRVRQPSRKSPKAS